MTLHRREFLHAAGLAAGAAYGSRLFAKDAPQNDVAWLAEVQSPPSGANNDAAPLPPLLCDETGKPIASLDAWRRRRESIRRQWLDLLHPFWKEPRPRPTLTVLEEDRPEGVVRQRVRYEVEPGMSVEAYLLKPQAAGRRRPGAVVFHSTVNYSIYQPAGLEGDSEKGIGLELARRGFVAFAPRNYLWPENRKMALDQEATRFAARCPGSRGMAKMLYDGLVAVDILAAQPEVDPGRIGAVGHSLGAKESLYLAAFDDRVRAAVSSEGGVGLRLSNWDAPWYLGPGVRRSDFGHDHHELLALIAPRPFLLIGGDSADGAASWPYLAAATPVYRLYPGPVRLGLFDHHKGHSVPPEAKRRACEWLERYC